LDSGNGNFVIGKNAGESLTSGINNTAIGVNALQTVTTAANNFAIGTNALQDNTSGYSNTAIGTNALANNTTGANNFAVGSTALFSNTTGAGNFAIGTSALVYLNNGNLNTAVGGTAGAFLANGTSQLTTASNNVYVGYFTKASANSVANENVFGFSATGIGTNTVRIGNSSITAIEGQVSFSTPSDARDKKNVQPLNDGLNIINALRPVKYVWHTRDNAKVDVNDIGFIAQEVDAVQYEGIDNDYLNLVNYNSVSDRWTITNAKFTPIIVKAIQEQQTIIETLQTELDAKSLIIETQEQKITDLETTIQALITRIEILENK
jgi:hypothetical protein